MPVIFNQVDVIVPTMVSDRPHLLLTCWAHSKIITDAKT